MPISCIACGCANRQGKPGLKFFRFPKEKERRSQWIAAVKRENWCPSEYSRLCSAHFITGKSVQSEVVLLIVVYILNRDCF
jgi:hypothetical protein